MHRCGQDEIKKTYESEEKQQENQLKKTKWGRYHVKKNQMELKIGSVQDSYWGWDTGRQLAVCTKVTVESATQNTKAVQAKEDWGRLEEYSRQKTFSKLSGRTLRRSSLEGSQRVD